jgi:hypothetical protein
MHVRTQRDAEKKSYLFGTLLLLQPSAEGRRGGLEEHTALSAWMSLVGIMYALITYHA